MPTNFQRIAVTNDGDLSSALERVRPLLSGEVKTARLVHDLAIRGAEELLTDEVKQEAARRRLAKKTTQRSGLDWQLLENLDRDAWGYE